MTEQKKRIFLRGSFLIDLTQKCNLNCAHCFRGEAQNVTMKKEVIDALFDQIKGIEHLTISGGEPLIVPDAFTYFIDEIVRRKIVIGSAGLVTNGTIRSEAIAAALNKLDMYIRELQQVKSEKRHPVGIAISNDEFHRAAGVTQDMIDATNRFYREHCPNVRVTPRRYSKMEKLGIAGRTTTEMKGRVLCPADIPQRILRTRDKGIYCLIFDDMTLTPSGELIAGAYVENSTQNNEALLCNVLNDDIWECAGRWNYIHPERDEDVKNLTLVRMCDTAENHLILTEDLHQTGKQLQKDYAGLQAFITLLSNNVEYAEAWKRCLPSWSRTARDTAKRCYKHIADKDFTPEAFADAYNTIAYYRSLSVDNLTKDKILLKEAHEAAQAERGIMQTAKAAADFCRQVYPAMTPEEYLEYYDRVREIASSTAEEMTWKDKQKKALEISADLLIALYDSVLTAEGADGAISMTERLARDIEKAAASYDYGTMLIAQYLKEQLVEHINVIGRVIECVERDRTKNQAMNNFMAKINNRRD